MPVFSKEVERTLRRALSEANHRRHESATLEHLLLALIDDADAKPVLEACGCDIPRLQQTTRRYVDSELETLISDSNEEAKATDGFQRVVQRAAFHVQSAGREEVTGANILVAIFAERETHAAYFLQQEDMTRYDAVNYISHGVSKKQTEINSIQGDLARTATLAPRFSNKAGRLAYVERGTTRDFKDRKSTVASRLNYLSAVCGSRANEQPQLNELIGRYRQHLSRLRNDGGSYSLFLTGLDIESLVRIKSGSKVDYDRNAPLDADQLFAVRSLMTAHAGLMVLFPDINDITTEFDRYKDLSSSALQAVSGIVDKALIALAEAGDIFDDRTHDLLASVSKLETVEEKERDPSKGAVATKHSWLRGTLAAIGTFIVEKMKDTGEKFVKRTIDNVVEHPVATLSVSVSITTFLATAKPILLSLAATMHVAFGWIASLLELMKI
jgi:Clp amino terminal domain, pathogenicity island component